MQNLVRLTPRAVKLFHTTKQRTLDDVPAECSRAGMAEMERSLERLTRRSKDKVGLSAGVTPAAGSIC